MEVLEVAISARRESLSICEATFALSGVLRVSGKCEV
jgi:hypothetical protein